MTEYAPPPYIPGQLQQPTSPGAPTPPRRNLAVPILSAILVVAVLAVGGLVFMLISRDKAPAAVKAAASATTTPAASEYDSAQRLVGALNENGIACSEWESVPNPINATDLGNCFVGTEEVVVAIHEDHAQAAGEPAYLSGLTAGSSDVNVVVGGNWTLSCDSATLCARIAKEFGGQYVHVPA